MAKYRNNLPQLSGDLFLTDGGLETTLIFLEGIELPDFAAFGLLSDVSGYESLRKYYRTYAAIAREHRVGFILESATWRASSDWGIKLGYSREELAELNRKSIALLEEIRNEYETAESKMVISGCVGPRGDGYSPSSTMSADDAERYHEVQIRTFRQTEADMVAAITMTYVEEAIGITRAARAAGMPVAISFTVETDGRLPTGETLKDAITRTDESTGNGPAYYMINCAHPTHFDSTLAPPPGEAWSQRIRGVRANASTKSHAELNESVELDDGNPAELGEQYAALRRKLATLNVLGGCCGTDHRHIEEISRACVVRKA
ncbi:MAG: homocysteine S-methyltransferase family protein, partial [Gemmatimonadaceae bacterium]